MAHRPSTSSELMHVKNYGQLVNELEHQEGCIRVVKNGATVKIYGPHGLTIIHNHPGQQPKLGTLRSILKMAVLAGILASVLVLAIIIM